MMGGSANLLLIYYEIHMFLVDEDEKNLFFVENST